MSLVDCLSGCGAWMVEAMAGDLQLIIFSVVWLCSVVIVVGCIVGIGIVIGVSIRNVVVSFIKLTRMLAFSMSKLMRCGGTVMGM